MLKRFLYLDATTLADYVSALEGGIRESLERKTSTGKNASGGVKASVVEAAIGRTRGTEESASFTDTPQAQFERLMELARTEPKIAGWVDVVDPDIDLQDIGVGALIDIECDIYVPEIVKALTPDGGLVEALDKLDALLPFVSMFDATAAQGLPSEDERDAFRGFVGALGGKALVVGDLDSSNWRIAGQLESGNVKGDMEGTARITGKVSKRWGEGQWKPLLALPGSSLISREQRRALERTKPKEGEEDQYLEGPALMLDILAIYR
ncbi:DUF6414 family protein [Streptomyces sp. NBC_01497]|uniref:DUF6414 family protein n=1 Tax=Streptomyces sp. NBC_01497 TaxID=2903885 RepID=UPI002E2FEF1B|nr:hypothetical protein [Streptomyces sp. NBC_01497]